MAMFTTFFVWTLYDRGVPLLAAILLGMVAGFLIGAIVHQATIRPFGDPHQNPLSIVIVTIGLFLSFNALAQLIWGTDQQILPPLFGEGSFSIGAVTIAYQKVGTVAVLGIEALALWVLFTRTKLGLAMRAVASNPESSALVGIPVNKVLMMAWGLAAAIGAVAGAFTAPISAVDSNLMQLVLIFGFAAITLGGFDSFVGAVVGGLIVGVLTDVVPRYVDAVEKMPLAPAFLLILLVLAFRPQGLFGSKKVTRV